MTQRKDKRATDCRTQQFPLSCKGGNDVRGFRRHLLEVSTLVQQGHHCPQGGSTSSLHPSLLC